MFWAPLEENLAMHSDGILWWIWDWIFPQTLHLVYIDTTIFARRNPISWGHFYHERYKRYTYPILFLNDCMKALVKRNGCSDHKIDILESFLYVGGMTNMTNVQCWSVKKSKIKKTGANNVDGWTRYWYPRRALEWSKCCSRDIESVQKDRMWINIICAVACQGLS